MLTNSASSKDTSDCASEATYSFISFDGGSRAAGAIVQPDRYRFWDSYQLSSTAIPRGAGLSYTGASFTQNGLSVSHSAFNRIVDFDRENKIVEVETGISLHDLYSFLFSQGLYLPVQPGHGQISVGGCIAADVHGKNNYRDGTFISQVISITLFHPMHGILHLSRDHEPDLFYLTCGGYGLTGHILKAQLQASAIPAQIIDLRAVKIESIQNSLSEIQNAAAESDFVYTWHDFTGKGDDFGKGFLFKANFAEIETSNIFQTNKVLTASLTSEDRAILPFSLFNHTSAFALNIVYKLKQRKTIRGIQLPLYQALFPAHQLQIYFKLFGRSGFHEYQALLPLDKMCDYLSAIKGRVSRGAPPITLASAKAFGGTQSLLRFSGNGICFALNFPRGQQSHKFMAFLDECLIDLGGIPNIIKDSRLPRSVIDACYPEADRFRSLLHDFDPKRTFRSELSERLGL